MYMVIMQRDMDPKKKDKIGFIDLEASVSY